MEKKYNIYLLSNLFNPVGKNVEAITSLLIYLISNHFNPPNSKVRGILVSDGTKSDTMT